MGKAGVTRLAELTYLDRLGIPNFVAVRPVDRGPGITYYNGKGTTRDAALAGAMMEAVERYSGERWDRPVRSGTFGEIRQLGGAVDPAEILVPRNREVAPHTKLEWVEGFDLIRQQPTWVPLNTVVCPYQPRDHRTLWYSSTNGLASGNTIEEAICHALCEIIERHALAMSRSLLDLRPKVRSVLARLGLAAAAPSTPDDGRVPRISVRGLPRRAARLVGRIRAAGFGIHLQDFTWALGVPTFDCTIREDLPGRQRRSHGGYGCHPDARVAVVRAISEAAQSRLTCIQGGREDLPELIAAAHGTGPEEPAWGADVRPFSAVPSYEHGTIDEDIRFLLGRLRERGLDQAVAVDLTRQELGVPVVRLVVPGTECWTLFQSHTGRGVLGAHSARILFGEEIETGLV